METYGPGTGGPFSHRRDDGLPACSEDLTKLNSLLCADLRFKIEPAPSSVCGTAPGTAGTQRRAESGRAPEAMGVLMHATSMAEHRRASFPIVCSSIRRELLHSLAGSLAECAMTLGLGAGVYYRRRAGPSR